MEISKRLIDAKINNQIIVLKRYAKADLGLVEAEIQNMKLAKSKIFSCMKYDEVMGYEGNAAREYFSGISKIINPEFSFKGRNKMPPKDPFNSMLSLGYTLLMYEFYGEIENKGLSPFCGFMHKDRERHPTLASDLMEEWRAVIVDSVVLNLIQSGEIHKEDFNVDEETQGVFLTKNGMKIFINKYENKLRAENRYINNLQMSFRKCLWYQVNELRRAIEESNFEIYKPIYIR